MTGPGSPSGWPRSVTSPNGTRAWCTPSPCRYCAAGTGSNAVDAFRGLYRLRELRAQTAPAWAAMDVLAVPTVPTTFTIAEMLADPIHRNTVLGTYTTFTNLLDLAAIALPAGRTAAGRPHGITLLAPAGQDAWLGRLAAALEPVLQAPASR